MARDLYPSIPDNSNLALGDFCREVTRQRQQDVEEFSNLYNLFMQGRKVGKIPTGSSDVTNQDRIGDFNYDTDYLYICVNDSGASWRRVAIGSW